MASFNAVRNDREPLSNPYQTHDLCPVNLCPNLSPHGVFLFGVLSLSDLARHDFAILLGLDIANWGLPKESPVLAIELARAFVADLECRTCRVHFTRKHALPRGMQAKLLLKLQRTHRRKGRENGSAA
jgi:hypothetical protein